MPDQKDNLHPSVAVVGLNMENTMGQKTPGTLSYANNAVVEGFDGNSITYQSEQANQHCLDFPSLYKVVGCFNITQINKVIYFLANESTGDSQIGYTDNNDGIYRTLLEGSCLNFSTEYPIHQIVVKSTDCSTQFYWTDNYNQRRYIDLDNLPWKEEKNPDNDFMPIKLVGQVDCNKLLIQPHFSIPTVKAVKEIIGGQLKMGTYQATIQYANVLGEGLTSFYNITNPFSINRSGEGLDFDAITTKAIEYGIENLDTSGLYDFFNLAIIKTINGIASVELAGTFPITGTTYNYTYSGTETSNIRLTIEDIFLKYKYYEKAEGVLSVDDVVAWYGLTSPKDVNYQEIANKITVLWETWKIPYNKFEGYSNGVNTEQYKGYMRDEVYPLEFVPLFRNGRQGHGFTIPGRAIRDTDNMGVDFNNKDTAAVMLDPCDEPSQKKTWEVYNTATLLGYSKEYLDYTGEDSCYKGPYQYGEMAYWESSETYPNNPLIWGELAGKPIRHHKFPDSLITHIHDNNDTADKSYQHSIYPIGIRVEGIQEAIAASSLTQEQKDDIIGFKIVRGNRANNKSVVAKGMFNNVGKYTYVPANVSDADSQTYFYPNYPFNDLRPDPYFTERKIRDHSGFRPDQALKGFNQEESKSRFVFYSPDTQFFQPNGIDSGQLKLECITYGESYGHFVPVDNNAKYLFLNKNGYKIAYATGLASMVNGEVSFVTPYEYGVGAHLAPENFPTTFQGMLDLLNKILPHANFGYSFNSIGYYNKARAVPNDGNKIRNINFGKYLNSEYETIETGNTINNYQRENSVYLNTSDKFLFPHEYSVDIPADTSRYNLSSYTNNDVYQKFFPVFLSNNSNVTDEDIYQALLNTGFGGTDVITIQYTGNNPPVTYNTAHSAGTPIRQVEIYRNPTTTNPNHVLVGTIELLSAGYNGSGSAYDGGFTGTLIQGNFREVVSPLLLTSDDTATTGNGVVIYKNGPGAQPENYQWKVSPGTYFGFDHLLSQTYQTYAINHSDEIDTVRAKVRNIFAGIATVDDIENLEIASPSTNNHFLQLVAYNAYNIAYARFQQGLEKEYSVDKLRKSEICSYYGSIKKVLPSQWGAIFSYETIDTGFYSPLREADGTPKTKFPTIFGGDIFINRHAFKIKLPFFEDNTVLGNNDADIEYDKIATLTHPMFWISTRPTDIRSSITEFLEHKANRIMELGTTSSAGRLLGAGIIGMEISFKVIKEVLAGLGIRNLNLDNFSSAKLYEQGIMYLFAYGIPYYFCESEVNVEMRHAKDARQGNFYPNVSGEIPDKWLQEANVSIIQPEQFSYNVSYSKQNKENYFSHLRLDYDPEKACFYTFQNRAVWSDKTSLEETKNNWLTYRPANYFDFPKAHGRLTGLNTLQNKLVLARFENKSQLYNSMVRINTSSPEGAYVGNNSLFSGTPPMDLSDSSGGSFGSQHKFLLNTEQGNIYIDAKRGQVVLLRGQAPMDITTKGMDKWFKHFLPFFILEVDPNIPIDNHFNGIGLTGVYDTLYKRAIITKKDYEPIVDGITYNESGEFIFNGKVISLDDSNYFCDRSWTLSYSFVTQSWTSFHSYQPNFYIEHAKYFQSGRNGSVSSVWDHNTSFTLYHDYYGTTYPYILEYPVSYQFDDEILQNIKDYTKSLKFTNYETFTAPKETCYFNKAVIYNDQQCSGILNLVPKKGLASYGIYPKYNGDSKDIQVTKADSFFQFNQFWNITKDPDNPIWNKTCSFKFTNKTLNFSNLDYNNKAYTKAPMRAKECYIRLIKDEASDVRLISRFIVSPTEDSK